MMVYSQKSLPPNISAGSVLQIEAIRSFRQIHKLCSSLLDLNKSKNEKRKKKEKSKKKKEKKAGKKNC
jgi:hypothetical protein